jgi:hypothetical protein
MDAAAPASMGGEAFLITPAIPHMAGGAGRSGWRSVVPAAAVDDRFVVLGHRFAQGRVSVATALVKVRVARQGLIVDVANADERRLLRGLTTVKTTPVRSPRALGAGRGECVNFRCPPGADALMMMSDMGGGLSSKADRSHNGSGRDQGRAREGHGLYFIAPGCRATRPGVHLAPWAQGRASPR